MAQPVVVALVCSTLVFIHFATDVLNSLKISIFNYYLINCDQLSEIKTPKTKPKLIKVLLKQTRGKKCHKKFYSESKKSFG